MTDDFREMMTSYEKEYFSRNEHLNMHDPEVLRAVKSAIREAYLFGYNAGCEAETR